MSILRLKEVLSEKNISGKELAERVGVTENTISFMSTGKTQPRFELLLKIAKELDVDLRDLFNATKENVQTLYVKDGDGFRAVGEIKKTD